MRCANGKRPYRCKHLYLLMLLVTFLSSLIPIQFDALLKHLQPLIRNSGRGLLVKVNLCRVPTGDWM
ncbi:hypothetical protein N658DRAFT_27776 [Parathielavia hyrcaniae]|uniref:Uncharacterized protein n=1 Tax=Parathielavia hyrcaniae TaxID=113614 RepID=A0AAN6T7B3_9PEZI|nr:hypothetical protein N658DRAFT_27776 [Parathielavia hyrcaniae]